jgi:hypothetical protein
MKPVRQNENEKGVHDYFPDNTATTKYTAAIAAARIANKKTKPMIERSAPPIHDVTLFLLSASANTPYMTPKTASQGSHGPGALKNEKTQTMMKAPLMKAPTESVTPAWTACLVSNWFMPPMLKPLLEKVNF